MKRKTKDKPIHLPHDKLFKATFEITEAAIDCVRYLLPPHIAATINLDNFKRDNTHYVSKLMKSLFSDEVYRTTLMGRNSNVAIALLWDHKSNPDDDICFQLIAYMLAIWQQDIINKRDRTIVIPIVFYHGETKWDKQKLSESFKGMIPELEPFVPNFDYHLISVNDIPDEEILKLSKTTLLGALLLMYKKINDLDFLRNNKSEIFEFLKNSPQYNELFLKFAMYFIDNVNLEEVEIIETVNTFPNKIKSSIMTGYGTIRRVAIQEGLKEGMEKGIEKGMEKGMEKGIKAGEAIAHKKAVTRLLLRGILSIPEIADALEIPISFVIEIRDSLLKEGNSLLDSVRDFKI